MAMVIWAQSGGGICTAQQIHKLFFGKVIMLNQSMPPNQYMQLVDILKQSVCNQAYHNPEIHIYRHV